jgi:hypothetical protein
MPSDLSRDITALAPSPRSRFDFDRTWRRGQQLRRRRQLYSGMAACLLVGGIGAGIALPFDSDPGQNVKPGIRQSEPPEATDSQELAERRAALNRVILQLRTRLEQLRTTRLQISLSLKAARDAGRTSRVRVLESSLDELDARVSDLRSRLTKVQAQLRAVQSEASQPVIFPVQDPTNDVMQSLIEGTLTVRERCLYLSVDDGPYDLVLPIWPNGFSYEYDEDNISVLDADGQTVGQTGSPVSMGGGMVGETEDAPLPPDLRPRVGSCDGPYWIVGEISESS